MRVKTMYRGLMVASFALAFAVQAWAYPKFAHETKAACAACHVNVAGGPGLSAAGTAFKDEKKAPDTKVAGAEYVGAKKCMMCHAKQHKAFATTPHAKAYEKLKAATPEQIAAMTKTLGVEIKGNPAESDACVPCHVTGFQLAGGYPAKDDSTKNVALSAVGCEACHGPGSMHVKAAMADKKKVINGSVTGNMCKQCHTAAISPKFDFDAMKVKVHPVPAAK